MARASLSDFRSGIRSSHLCAPASSSRQRWSYFFGPLGTHDAGMGQSQEPLANRLAIRICRILPRAARLPDAQDARAWPNMVSASVNIVNAALVLYDKNGKAGKNRPNEVGDVIKMLSNLRAGLVASAHHGKPIFNALGVIVLDCENDNTKPVRVTSRSRAQVPGHADYPRMIADIGNSYQ